MEELLTIIIAIGVLAVVAYYGYGLLCDIFDI
jgi:hypothetical protein